ncbi:MAG: heme exporter protein CcmB [Bacteroidetes bacterium]|nr:heme exporter protein CcmB [Bacteroidota bacterium]
MANPTLLLVYKDILLEVKSKSAFGSIILYLVSTVFVCFLAFDGIVTMKVWNALFWIILLFASFNSILKSFIQESPDRSIYYYTLVSPTAYINAKLVFNTFMMLVLALIALIVFLIFMGNVVSNLMAFIIVVGFGVVGISSVLTLMSAIASKVRNNFTLVSILSFPVFLPQLLVLMRASESAINGRLFIDFYPDILISFVISLIAMLLSNTLFPYIWQD